MTIFPPAPRRQRGDFILPMINIVFLLLIFFMVAGQISRTVDAQIDPPQAQNSQPLDSEKLELVLSADGSISNEGQALTLDDLDALIGRQIEEGTLLDLILTADRSIQAATLDPVLTRLRELGVKTVRLRTLRVEES